MEPTQIIETHSAQETKKIARNLASQLSGGEVLALYGELGSGKTTFVQGLAEGLGIKDRVLSPTFVLMRQYDCHIGRFSHIDCYRIDTMEQAEGLGLEEIFADPHAVVAIEWAERVEELLPQNCLRIYFEYGDGNTREVKVLRARSKLR
ncbi:tRNA (adenosine(37)-N6)-threonylcarbamoyltransferase complex ATPase subunit type 1 TsaE [Candidatus Parcubacteria bacterium]|nr:tRNA (adenosine(37)-N6)-threonylcarbamoyltransferase complex ATPase subunit type 1 TsaE [Candidatus Parcubacteria bacterium]